MPTLRIITGDIARVGADAIVNAANTRMRGGGGVDGAIHRGGGPAVLDDCIARFPNGLAVGDAGWTTAGDLPARHLIHTVGPNYAAGQRDRSLLESCYRRSLRVADELGARTVAFPLISAGVYGWPIDDAVAVAIDTISAASTAVEEVTLVAFTEALAETMRSHQLVATPLRIIQGVREVHRLGYGDVRFVPHRYALGTWRIEISTADNVRDTGSQPRVGDAAATVRHSSAAGSAFAGGVVTGATPIREVADLILSQLPQAARRDGSPDYERWLAELEATCVERRALPMAFGDELWAEDEWRLTDGGTVSAPPA
ncbi:macro domain-containing protein [Gordonia shandongensis]|uniref:macro domain-containing protein n=1 Tax=Gordonia shandongensis TaxID=376351 RepID=UPI00041F0A13